MKRKNKSAFSKNSDEIKYNIINSILAGCLVFLGSIAGNGFKFSLEGFILAFITGLIVAISKFQDYFKTQEGEYISKKIFSFAI